VVARTTRAVEATDQLFRFLGGLIDPEMTVLSAGGDGAGKSGGCGEAENRTGIDPARAEALARKIDQILPGRRISILRDDGDPVGRECAEITLSDRDAAALRALEKGQAEFLPVERIMDRRSAAEFRDKTVRVVDSCPETLYNPTRYRLDDLAAQIFGRHRRVAEALRRRLRFRDARLEIVEHGHQRGEIDESALAEVGTGNRNIYLQRIQIEARRMDLILLLDESGSMGTGDRWKLAAAAALCLEYAVSPLESVRLRVYGFSTDCFVQNETVIYRHYDSAVPRLRRWKALGWPYPKQNNADGVALAAMRHVILQDYSPETIPCLLMISDGLPRAHNYEGRAAEEHVRREVQETLRRGIQFAHLMVGPTDASHLDAMYGSRWRRVTQAEEIPAQVAALVLRWLDPAEMQLG
jgi:uncharacterized protein with von Willebrand factor type A (vWA) domain